jgi:hypothetical protein
MSFVNCGNRQRGFYDRQLGKSGILATAKRIQRIEKELKLSYDTIPDLEYLKAIYNIIENKGKVKDREIVKRLLQQLEQWIWCNLDDNQKTKLLKEFEK